MCGSPWRETRATLHSITVCAATPQRSRNVRLGLSVWRRWRRSSALTSELALTAVSGLVLLQLQFFGTAVHFPEMEIQRAEFFQFALLEMFRHIRVGFQDFEKIRIVAAGVFDFPGLHRAALDERVGVFAGEALLDECEQDG